MKRQTNEHVVSGLCLAAPTELPIEPRRELSSAGALVCAERPAPLAGRIKTKSKPKKPVKPNIPPVKRLRFFSDFDDRGFHPTMEFAFLMADPGNGWPELRLHQLWRHRDTDKPEWRTVQTLYADQLTTPSTISSDSPNSAAADSGKPPEGP